ncbi:MAG: GNAT family N-acetyltransferase [Deinococcota bacterium]
MTELAGYLNQAFEGYVIPFQFTAASAANLFLQDGISLSASRLMFERDRFVGLGLMSRRGQASRMAALAIVPAARGQGLGKYLVDVLTQAARDRADTKMWLEVISQNTAAVTLYKRAGFNVQRKLVGFSVSKPVGNLADAPLERVNPLEVARSIISHMPLDYPWQLSGESLIHVSAEHQAWRCGPAAAIISNPAQDSIFIRGLVTEQAEQRRGQASRLLRALFAQFPDKTWKVSIIVPEQLAGLFHKLGMTDESLSQAQMMKALV